MLGSTGQTNFLDKENCLKYLAREKETDIHRKEQYLNVKVQFMQPLSDDVNPAEVPEGAADSMNY